MAAAAAAAAVALALMPAAEAVSSSRYLETLIFTCFSQVHTVHFSRRVKYLLVQLRDSGEPPPPPVPYYPPPPPPLPLAPPPPWARSEGPPTPIAKKRRRPHKNASFTSDISLKSQVRFKVPFHFRRSDRWARPQGPGLPLPLLLLLLLSLPSSLCRATQPRTHMQGRKILFHFRRREKHSPCSTNQVSTLHFLEKKISLFCFSRNARFSGQFERRYKLHNILVWTNY